MVIAFVMVKGTTDIIRSIVKMFVLNLYPTILSPKKSIDNTIRIETLRQNHLFSNIFTTTFTSLSV